MTRNRSRTDRFAENIDSTTTTSDHFQRDEFADYVLENENVDDIFAKNIVFSDEVQFQLNGYVYKLTETRTLP